MCVCVNVMCGMCMCDTYMLYMIFICFICLCMCVGVSYVCMLCGMCVSHIFFCKVWRGIFEGVYCVVCISVLEENLNEWLSLSTTCVLDIQLRSSDVAVYTFTRQAILSALCDIFVCLFLVTGNCHISSL